MITIEPVSIQELKQLADLYEELVGDKTNIELMERAFNAIKEREEYILIGAKHETMGLVGSLMGIICIDIVGECRPFMVVENLIVSPQSRRQGVGKNLIEFAEAYAREWGCYYSMLVSRTDRAEAHVFYESVGYPIGVVQGFKKYL